jgi:hypothetical protein
MDSTVHMNIDNIANAVRPQFNRGRRWAVLFELAGEQVTRPPSKAGRVTHD